MRWGGGGMGDGSGMGEAWRRTGGGARQIHRSSLMYNHHSQASRCRCTVIHRVIAESVLYNSHRYPSHRHPSHSHPQPRPPLQPRHPKPRSTVTVHRVARWLSRTSCAQLLQRCKQREPHVAAARVVGGRKTRRRRRRWWWRGEHDWHPAVEVALNALDGLAQLPYARVELTQA